MWTESLQTTKNTQRLCSEGGSYVIHEHVFLFRYMQVEFLGSGIFKMTSQKKSAWGGGGGVQS